MYRLLFLASLALAIRLPWPDCLFGASTDTHHMAARTAARLAPEPFRSNWSKCVGGVHPDYMRDQPLGHENARLAGLLYTLEAIRYLREGRIDKAMLTASARTHYISDGACIAHAEVWRPRHPDDVRRPDRPASRVWSFLPAGYRDYRFPFEASADDPDGLHLKIGPPPVHQETWRQIISDGMKYRIHAFFDRTSCRPRHPDGFPIQDVPDTSNWSAYDREFFGRREAECIALDLIQRQSALDEDAPLEFVPEEVFHQVVDREMGNMVASIVAYYRYLTVAADTQIVPDAHDQSSFVDMIESIASHEPRIHVDQDAPWPLKRALYILAMETVRAKHALEGRRGREYAANLRVETDAVFSTLPMQPGHESRRAIITWGSDTARAGEFAQLELEHENTIAANSSGQAVGHVILHGKDLQSTIHLVDYFLDLTHAPLAGRAPVAVLREIFQSEWPGTPFLKDLRNTPDEQVFNTPALLRPANPHLDDAEQWADKVHQMFRPRTRGDSNLSGPLPVFWNFLLLELPLPDGSSLE